MKKLFYFLTAIIIYTFPVLSNPIVLPKAYISELKFDTNNNWVLEISFEIGIPYYHQQYDSICISTSYGFSRINLENVKDSSLIMVVDSDSLSKTLAINKNGDCIKLYSYLSNQYFDDVGVDSLIFGNYKDSKFDSIPSGYSIARIYFNMFALDKSPTIGLPNDTIGTCGTLKGFMYDKNNNLISSGTFILDNPIIFQNNSMFSTKVFSRKFTVEGMLQQTACCIFRGIVFDTLRLDVYPDSIYYQDIHISSDIVDGIKGKKPEESKYANIINYPNPFNLSTTFYIKVPNQFAGKQGIINIYNVKGQLIKSIRVKGNSRITWNSKNSFGQILSSGVYYYQFVLGRQIIKNGSMILLK